MVVSRLPWQRGPEAFQRHWLVLGPLTAAEASPPAAQQLAMSTPAPGLEQTLAGGRSLRWLPYDSWTDVVDVSDLLSGSGRQDAATPGAFGFAQATVDVTEAGKVEIAIGSDEPLALWLNGEACGETAREAGFAPDESRMQVTLRAGSNHVLVRLAATSGKPVRFTFHIVAPGTVLSPVTEIAPRLVDVSPASVQVLTDSRPRPGAPPVHVAIIAAGGEVVGQADVPRGQTASFDATPWADGPYELKCTTSTSWGDPRTVFLSWYKGDALAAARGSIAVAAAAGSDAPLALTERAVAEILRDRLGPHIDQASAPASILEHLYSPLLEFAELELEKRGTPARARGDGFYRLAWIDEVDGSPQFCRAYLPPDYDPARRWPIVISLHGFNPANPKYPGWWSVDQRHHGGADRHHVIVLEPHGRGNAQYLGIGERDVLRSLEEAERHFSVDEDRVYLTGESMGGSGVWLIGSRHPGLFAAIAPTFGGWDLRIAPPSGGDPRPVVPRDAREDFAMEQRSSFRGAEQLLNLPVFIHHGDSDRAVSVEGSRYITRELQRWGYDVRYREVPGMGHEDLGAQDEIFTWLLQHRRARAPRQVRLRATELSGASAHWLRVQRFEEPERLILADAEMVAPGVLRLDSDNVAAVELSVPPALLPADRRLRVVWNGRQAMDEVLREGQEAVTLSNDSAARLAKRPGVEGPISDLIRTPFMVVVGTSSPDPLMRQRCREKAEAFATLWSEWQHGRPRVVDDTAVTPEAERTYSLLLVGGADANRVAQRMAASLPLTTSAAGVTIDGRTWAATDAVAQMIYPNPRNSDRYVLVVTATSADGMYFWNPALWNIPYGFPAVTADWVIQDGHRIRPGAGMVDPAATGAIASGVFDASWRRDDRWTIVGDPTLRGQSALRHAPPPGFSIGADTIRQCAGTVPDCSRRLRHRRAAGRSTAYAGDGWNADQSPTGEAIRIRQ